MSFVKYPLLVILFGGICSGCLVPQARYDELAQQHALEKQKSMRLSQQLADLGKQLTETRTTLEKLEVRLSGSQQELAHKQATLDSSSQTLAEVEYERSIKETEKQAAEGMVSQLREELTRIAGHIATLSAAKDQLRDERDKLLVEVTSLTARVKALEAESSGARQRTDLVRDLTLKLAEPMRAGRLQITAEQGGVELKFPSTVVFDAKSAAVSQDGRKLLALVSDALATTGAQVQISELAAERTVAQREAHIRQVAGELHAGGIALEQLSMRDDPSRPAQPKESKHKKAESEIVLRLRSSSKAPAAHVVPAG